MSANQIIRRSFEPVNDNKSALLKAGFSKIWNNHPGVALSSLFLAFLLLACLFPSLLATHDPFQTSAALAFKPPSAEYWFGTDAAGRDVYSRIVFGARQSLLVGVLATLIGLVGGIVLGLTSALSNRFIDAVLGRAIEVIFVFPTLLVALVLITVTGTGISSVIIAVGIGSIADNARLIRAQAFKVRHSNYVIAARALGHSRWQVIFRTILPNVMQPIVVIATIGVGYSILWAASLSFLGLGAQPPSPEWATMLADGRSYIQSAPWITIIPGVLLTLTVLSLTVLGRYWQRKNDTGI